MRCPECGGDGCDFEDSSKDCDVCHGSGVVPDKDEPLRDDEFASWDGDPGFW